MIPWYLIVLKRQCYAISVELRSWTSLTPLRSPSGAPFGGCDAPQAASNAAAVMLSAKVKREGFHV
jgi:hypothetical protein